MKVLEKTVMQDGTKIQIEDWQEDYSFMEYASTIALYPESKVNGKDYFAPNKGETFRMSFKFKSEKDARQSYFDLVNGNKELIDFKENLDGNCIDAFDYI